MRVPSNFGSGAPTMLCAWRQRFCRSMLTLTGIASSCALPGCLQAAFPTEAAKCCRPWRVGCWRNGSNSWSWPTSIPEKPKGFCWRSDGQPQRSNRQRQRNISWHTICIGRGSDGAGALVGRGTSLRTSPIQQGKGGGVGLPADSANLCRRKPMLQWCSSAAGILNVRGVQCKP